LKIFRFRSFKNTYGVINKLITSPDFIARHRQESKDFTRERTLTFDRLIMLLLNQIKCSLQSELDRFFPLMNLAEVGQRIVTNAALSKARKKLKASAFIELNEQSLATFYEDFPVQKRWHGFRLLAVDGSKVELPNDLEIRDKFDTGNMSDCPMGLLSTLYDLNHKLWLDADLSPISKSEREHAVKHLQKTKEGDLILYDRGYPAFWFFALHRQQERDFCIRLQRSLFPETDVFFNSGESERVVTLKASKPRRRDCRKHSVPYHPLTLRLIRVELESGDIEVLATSLLDTQQYPAEIFGDLYHQRWGHEEGYKHLKMHGELQNWSGKKLATVYQDLHAKLLTLNLTSMQMAVAQVRVDERTKNRKYRYQVNRAQALSRMKDAMIQILNGKDPALWIRRLIGSMAENINPIRTGRKFERKHHQRAGIRVNPTYKRGW
jgi:hypothetical protein